MGKWSTYFRNKSRNSLEDRFHELEKETWELKQEVKNLEQGSRRKKSLRKKVLVTALILALVVLAVVFISDGDDQTVLPDEPDTEVVEPQPLPDISSWWETFTDWAAGMWQSIQDFFTGLFERWLNDSPPDNNEPQQPVEPEPEEELPEENG